MFRVEYQSTIYVGLLCSNDVDKMASSLGSVGDLTSYDFYQYGIVFQEI